MLAGKNPEPRKVYKKRDPFNYKIEEYISLPKSTRVSNSSLFNVINNRKSERLFGSLSLQQLSNLLWHSAKAKRIMLDGTGAILSHRPSPSAGAIHPIDIFVSLSASIGKRKLYYYDPFVHKLMLIKVNKKKVTSFFKNVNGCMPLGKATLIWFVAHPDRTSLKYKNYDSLIWRDAGALTMTVQLVATALNIKSCPLGTLGEPFLSNSFDEKLFSAGGLLLG